MKERAVIGMLALALALGFVFSIESLAQNSRPILKEPGLILSDNAEVFDEIFAE